MALNENKFLNLFGAVFRTALYITAEPETRISYSSGICRPSQCDLYSKAVLLILVLM